LITDFFTALKTEEKIDVTGLRESGAAMLAAWAAESTNRPVLCVVPTERQAVLFEQDLNLFSDRPLVLYPGYDIPPYTPLSPDPTTITDRLSTLYRLHASDRPLVAVASSEALLRRTIPKNRLTGLAELIICHEETDQTELVQRLTAAGYDHVSLVQRVGDFSLRGGIVDVFPPGFAAPVRLDFFGDTVESLRSFDPVSQRSLEELEEVIFLPASDILFPPQNSNESEELTDRFRQQGTVREWNRGKLHRIIEQIRTQRRFPGIEFFLPLIYPSLSSLFDYLPPNALLMVFDPPEIRRTIRLTWERIEANYNEAADKATPCLPPESVFLSEEEFDQVVAGYGQVRLSDFSEPDGSSETTFSIASGNHKLIKQEIDIQRKKHGLLLPLIKHISHWLDQGDHVALTCRSQRHAGYMAELLGQHELSVAMQKAPFRPEDLDQQAARTVFLYDHPLSTGFELAALNLHLLSESELFGARSLVSAKKQIRKDRGDMQPLRFDELKSGDIVVHKEHGIGIYEGLVNMVLHGVPNDFLRISYQGQDKLYVPVDRINSVNIYKGISDKTPKIDRLGSKSWLNTKNKVKQAVWKVAQDLLKLYAKRELEKGHAFSQPAELFYELEETFPFDETAGQKKAISEILADLASEKPMDRLLCGDVGYGKTEVAIRAAFKVIEDGYQVAVLVPTTVLAEQHAQTFMDRFQGFPVEVKSLSRFRSASTQKQILNMLAAGQVDIIIGTHRLLSKDIIFKKLGLLIVDEEHRFGVSHKEKIKQLRSKVDVLTLSATPIPRTLQMSLLGVRDLSIINTPPEHRRSIKTFVARYDELVIKEAVIREMQRGGQIFLVHNRVRSIHEMASKVQKLVPEAGVAVAHGQMTAKHLEEVMVRFVNKELDVLVCTTIIESGLDISNANTIVINRADRLGLAEIYQLRGRVGRSSEQSYAYLLVPSFDSLTKDAKERFRALMDYSELGGGFKLAMSDLQIRGGGNILGISQSGHIAAVGYDLYLDLLQKTVSDMKRKAALLADGEEEVEPEINLQVSAYIPEQYILDANQRYLAYRKLSSVSSQAFLLDLRDEFIDRYGQLPAEAQNLFDIVALKMELKKIKISKLEQGKDNLVFTFLPQTQVAPEKIMRFMERSKERVRFTPDSRLIVHAPLVSPQNVFDTAQTVLAELQ